MGVLSDIIIASRDDAPLINAARGKHVNQWDCLASKGIDTIKLGTLSQILANQSVNDINTVATFMMDSILDKRSDDGPWVFLVPDQLVSSLISLNKEEKEGVTTKWAQTEEFQLDRWELEDVEEYFDDLIAHAIKARASRKSLLLWTSV
jgi:hypothetical protein